MTKTRTEKKTKKEIYATTNEWQKRERRRLVILLTPSEDESIRQQAEKEGQSLTRYLVKCHTDHMEQLDNQSSRQGTADKGQTISYRGKE